MKKIEQLISENSFTRLPQIFFSRVYPTPLINPYLVSFNQDVADLIELSSQEATRKEFSHCFIGNKLLPDSDPLAMVYAGHQFGHFVSQLGDGRAILLGEAKTSTGTNWHIQLKGAGPTPYSRNGDRRVLIAR